MRDYIRIRLNFTRGKGDRWEVDIRSSGKSVNVRASFYRLRFHSTRCDGEEPMREWGGLHLLLISHADRGSIGFGNLQVHERHVIRFVP